MRGNSKSVLGKEGIALEGHAPKDQISSYLKEDGVLKNDYRVAVKNNEIIMDKFQPSKKGDGNYWSDKKDLENEDDGSVENIGPKNDDENEAMVIETSIEENGDVVLGEVHVGKREECLGRRSLEDLLAMYEHEGEWEDEDDDKDWEPRGILQLRLRWFCTNCTMSNMDDDLQCALCGEHRESGILNHGFLAPCHLPAELPHEAAVERKGDAAQGGMRMTPISAPLLSPLPISSSVPLRRHTAIGFDERMLLHSEIQMKSHPHPERPDRLRSILAGLAAAGMFPGRCFTIPAREATRAELENVHTQEHVDAVEATSGQESSYFTSDTYANRNSALAARLAAGICAELATFIMKGQAQNGFALVRPPGHHAEESTVMGFCLHNNAAIAAKAALAAGAKKVLIVDWDVHHGNGTQEIFERDPCVLYISLHRHERGLFYPGTGAACEVGSDEGEGFSVNIPWGCAGIGDEDYIFAFQQIVLPIATQFAPDMTIISAGFDAASGDPLGGCEVTPVGYAHMASMLSSLAQGRMLVVLEGGYNLRSISASATAVVKVLSGESPGPSPNNLQPTQAGLTAVLEVSRIQSRYWKGLHVPFIKMISQSAASSGMQRGKLGRKTIGGPVWWRWGRKKVVYDHWFGTYS